MPSASLRDRRPLTISGAARIIGASESTIRLFVRTGRLQVLTHTESGIALLDPDECLRLKAERDALSRGEK